MDKKTTKKSKLKKSRTKNKRVEDRVRVSITKKNKDIVNTAISTKDMGTNIKNQSTETMKGDRKEMMTNI